MKVNREDVVQAALLVERWCAGCACEDCPFYIVEKTLCALEVPETWGLEGFMRNRGLKHD